MGQAYSWGHSVLQTHISSFLIFAPKHRLWVHVRRGGSNEYPQSMFRSKNKKKYQNVSAENFKFLKLKKSLDIAWASFQK